ncbi:MAG: single-stranded DNA-binding protein [Clostridia bacterium]|nr:single-stranded DNA-binding protein [Clostridia bacterium]
MNRVFLIGNLTKDPELTETSGGISLCRFSIAVTRAYSGANGDKKTDFFNCTAWRGLGDTVARYAHKGNKVAVEGSIELRNYEDNQGVKRTAVDIVCQNVEFLTPKSNGTENGENSPTRSNKPQLQPFDDDSDIPF